MTKDIAKFTLASSHPQNIQVYNRNCTIPWYCYTQHQHCNCALLYHIRQYLKIRQSFFFWFSVQPLCFSGLRIFT